jgi:glycosyltransferase involved in cell wall biosynthesis
MRIILCVTNSIVTDQRVNRIAYSLRKIPAELAIVGIKPKVSLHAENSPVLYKRFSMLFHKGPLFYFEYNLRLFFHLLFANAGIVVSNDLDTLLAVYMACKIRNIPVVYDSHEFFTGLPELVDRPQVRNIWQKIESLILPNIQYSYTVSDPIAAIYQRQYGIEMKVIRNLPFRISEVHVQKSPDEKTIIYQGALNMGRGLESAITAMKFLNNCRLVIAGSGYLENELKVLARSEGVSEKVRFTGLLHPEELVKLTQSADLGISLEENKGLNYQYALPNKVFDYIQARIPVLVSDLPEMAAVVKNYDVGMIAPTSDPLTLSGMFQTMLFNEELREKYKINLEKASAQLCWENEEPILFEIYNRVIRDHASLKEDK